MRRTWIVVVVAILILAFWIHQRQKSSGTTGGPRGAVHSVAPDFSLQDISGAPLSLASYRGKVVLLDFWATWCTPCRAEIPHFIEYQNKYGAQGLQIVGISMDDDAKPVRAFYDELKMNYPVALGTTQLADSFGGVLGLPVTFLIGRDGRIAAKYVGAVEMSIVEREMTSLLQTK
jgi:cytochrome c biogenesis protein CcmG/thiol:disulfide interchange protein DsbE